MVLAGVFVGLSGVTVAGTEVAVGGGEAGVDFLMSVTVTLHVNFFVFFLSVYFAVTFALPSFFAVSLTLVFFLAESFTTDGLLTLHFTFFNPDAFKVCDIPVFRFSFVSDSFIFADCAVG